MRIRIAAAAFCTFGLVCAAERPTLTLESSTLSHYVWRGTMLTNGPVLQNSANIGWRGAHFNLFTNQDLNRVNGLRGNISEVDYDAGYDYTRKPVTMSGGFVRYTFPHAPLIPTTELYAGASLDRRLHPSVRGYFDVEAFHGAYVTFDVSQGVSLPKLGSRATWEAVLAGGFGVGSARHNEAYFAAKKTALTDLHPTAALPVTIGRFKLTPKLGYAMVLDSELRRSPSKKVHGFFGGLTLTFTL